MWILIINFLYMNTQKETLSQITNKNLSLYEENERLKRENKELLESFNIIIELTRQNTHLVINK